MNILTFDVETTTSNNGNPFDRKNRLVMSGFLMNGSLTIIDHISGDKDSNYVIQDLIGRSQLIVGFNLKFDLHWLRNIGIDISNIKVWDCQLAEFMLSSQHNKYPSLDATCAKYGLPAKLDVVKTEYWDKGIDTDQIPTEILYEYLVQDLKLTEAVFKEQYYQFKGVRL